MGSIEHRRLSSGPQSRGLRLLEGTATLDELVDEALQERSSAPRSPLLPQAEENSDRTLLAVAAKIAASNTITVAAVVGIIVAAVVGAILIQLPSSLSQWVHSSSPTLLPLAAGILTAVLIWVTRHTAELVRERFLLERYKQLMERTLSLQDSLRYEKRLESMSKIRLETDYAFLRNLSDEIALERARADTVISLLRVTPPGVSVKITPDGAIEVAGTPEETEESQLRRSGPSSVDPEEPS